MKATVKDFSRWNVPHPIPYQGSKRSLAPLILSYFPPHVVRLVEPFAGSAAISLATAYRGLADNLWINDAHAPVIDLWREIVERPENLAENYQQLWQAQLGREREFYDSMREQFNKARKPALFLYLLARCVKAAIRYNGRGEFNNSPDNRRKGARPGVMRERIVCAAKLLHGRTAVSSLDYRQILANCDRTDLIYMDPPYRGVSISRDNRYFPKIVHDEFCDHLADLNKRRCRYVVSYDGRTGEKSFGKPLPKSLRLLRVEVHAGRSTQATLLGRDDDTFESLYLSEALAKAVGRPALGRHS